MNVLEAFLSADGGATVGILVGALLAAFGYVGKLIVESLRQRRSDRQRSLARLHQLQALLLATRATFLVQRDQADRLAEQLRSRFADELPDDAGRERLLAQFYDRLAPDEKDLHSIVRAYTEHALHPLNEAVLAWLRSDFEYRTVHGKKGQEAKLANRLNELDAHLLLWLAKYEAWIPDRPDHALVYLADEEEHGLGFPVGIEDTLEAVIARHT